MLKQTIPEPPAATEAEKPVEKPAEEPAVKPVEPVKPTIEAPEPMEDAEEEAEAETTSGDAANMEGTKPEVQVSEKLITTGEIKAAQAKQIKGKVEKALKAKASQSGFSDVQNIKMIKNECQAGGTCVGIGQGTAVKTTVTYSVGNAVAVKQDDGSKDAIIKKIEDGKYTVQFADGSEAAVEESALGLRK